MLRDQSLGLRVQIHLFVPLPTCKVLGFRVLGLGVEGVTVSESSEFRVEGSGFSF